MAQVKWETVHVFVSSTFSDMHAERDYLVKRVFPTLRDWCERRKLRLVDIDLRWGITEADATHNLSVVGTCLRRIDQCRPFFVCLVGQRYGWIPKAEDVPKEVFEIFPAGLKEAIDDGRSVTDLEILHATINPFHKPATMVERQWQPSEHAFFYLREPAHVDEAPDMMGELRFATSPDVVDPTYLDPGQMPVEPPHLRSLYDDQVEPDGKWRNFLLLRHRELRVQIEATRRPVRTYQPRWRPQERTPELEIPLECPSALPEGIHRWREEWRKAVGIDATGTELAEGPAHLKAEQFNERLTQGRLGDFACGGGTLDDVIMRDLQSAIEKRFPDHHEDEQVSELQRELDQQEQFIEAAADGFIPRTDDFKELNAYAKGDSRVLFVLVAPAGVGKSTLLAKWVGDRRNTDAGQETICARFIGASEHSTTVDGLLRLVWQELTAESGAEPALEIPDEPRKVREKLPDLLAACGKKRRTLVVLDALNQLDGGLGDLDWLPRVLPPNVKLLVSFKIGDEAGDRLHKAMDGDSRYQVSKVLPFESVDDRRKLVDAWLDRYLKALDPPHVDALVNSEGAANPLFLKIVLSELRVFGSFAKLGERIRSDFGTTPQSAFDAVLRRLGQDPAHSTIPSVQAVPLLFGLLAYSRGGLPDDLLARILLQALNLPESRRVDVEDTIRYLLRQVRPFLARREGRHDFFYDSFLLAVRARYTGTGEGRRSETAWHLLLADTCEHWPDLQGASERYALANLAHHQVSADRPDLAAGVLTHLGYLDRRLRQVGEKECLAIARDFGSCLDRWNTLGLPKDCAGAWMLSRLAQYSELVERSRHILLRDRHLLIQQAANEPRETSPRKDADERLRRNDPPVSVIRRLPEQEGTPTPLKRRHEMAVGWIEFVALSGDVVSVASSEGKWAALDVRLGLEAGRGDVSGVVPGVAGIASSSPGEFLLFGTDGRILRIGIDWGAVLSVEHAGASAVCADVSSDGSMAVLAGNDGRLAVYDLPTKRPLETIETGDTAFRCVRFVPGGTTCVSCNDEGLCYAFALPEGEKQFLFKAEQKPGCIDVSLDGRFVCVGVGATVVLADLASHRVTCLGCHRNRVFAARFVDDSSYLVTGGDDDLLMVWDFLAGKLVATEKANSPRITSFAYDSPSRTLFSAGGDGAVWVWDLERVVAREVNVEFGPDATVEGVIFLPRRYDALHVSALNDLVLVPGGRLAASIDNGGRMLLWDLHDMMCLWKVETFQVATRLVACLVEGVSYLVVGQAGILVKTSQGPVRAGARGSVRCFALVDPEGRPIEVEPTQGCLDAWSRRFTVGSEPSTADGTSAPSASRVSDPSTPGLGATWHGDAVDLHLGDSDVRRFVLDSRVDHVVRVDDRRWLVGEESGRVSMLVATG